MTVVAVVFSLALLGCGGGSQAADSGPTHPHAGEDVHYYDPDDSPENLSGEEIPDDGGGGGNGGPDGGDGGGGGPSVACTGPFFIDATDDSGAVAGRCEGEARLTRSGPEVVGELECEGQDALAPLGIFRADVAGDAGGDGSLTLEFDASGLRMVLYGSFDDSAITLRGEDRGRVGDQNLALVAEVSCLSEPG